MTRITDASTDRVMSLESINQKVVQFEYAVRGAQAIRAEITRKQLVEGPNDLPLRRLSAAILVIHSSSNSSHHFHRQSCRVYRKTRRISIGSRIRSSLTAGASPGVQDGSANTDFQRRCWNYVDSNSQYPLYTALLLLYGGNAVPYYLDESKDWGLTVASFKRLHAQIIEFCHRENVVLMADEVYQTNIYKPEESPFHSFKKVLKSEPLVNVTSGGYFECTGIDFSVKEMLYKIASVSLCPPVQILRRRAENLINHYDRSFLISSVLCPDLIGQVDGTYHFRSTFSLPEELMDQFTGNIKAFHNEFMKKYA
ncbi:glutamate-glyoxylate aminotransferase 1 [Batrachochytrium salamandrivorans]|nr:glutamate-glyoxylate aminotransferase 1 [Batrachochytrium salamandrivorans]